MWGKGVKWGERGAEVGGRDKMEGRGAEVGKGGKNGEKGDQEWIWVEGEWVVLKGI